MRSAGCLLLVLAACGSPPASVVPASLPPASSAPATPSTFRAEPTAPGVFPPSDGAAVLFDRFAEALNDGDLAAVQAASEAPCWAKDCRSLGEQAQRKFKVRKTEAPTVKGVRAAAWLEAVCDGKRLCDRVLILMARDCSSASGGGTWRVAQVTERKAAEADWLEPGLTLCLQP
jgi:hypothetical protein